MLLDPGDPSLILWTGLLVFALGLTVGSFLNVVIYRVPLGLSVVSPRSSCPSCGSLIRAWDNVPVLSYLWLRGRCRDCDISISWRYPAVETVTAILFLGSWWLFGPALPWLLVAGFCSLLVALALIDWDHLILPDRLTIPGTVLGILLHPVMPWGGSWLDGLIGAIVGAGVPLLLYGVWYLLRRVEGLGLGDVKMLALVGAFLGWEGALVTLLVGSVVATLRALWGMVWGRFGFSHRLAFGPFLSIGALAALIRLGLPETVHMLLRALG
ncbi:MAG: prepilin peptidase [Acidobacteriota bacterium]